MSKRKSDKEETGNLRRFIIDYLRELNSKKYISESRITKRFSNKFPKGDVIRTLYAMVAEGILSIKSGNKFKLKPRLILEKVKNRSGEEKIGTVDMTKNSSAYVIPEDRSGDIFIRNKDLNHALDHDKVKVRITRSGKKPEGVIEKVLERHRTIFIGIVDKSKYCFVRPDDPAVYADFFISEEYAKNLKHGDKVAVEMLDWPAGAKSPFGRVTEVLGKPGDNDVEMKSLLIEHGFFLKFGKETLREADNLSTKIPEKEYESRRDFRNITTFTIDPIDAKDYDDAISIREINKNLWEIGVHIADVSHYVKEGSALDEEAYKRATSVYLVDRVAPMLPEQLSNVICSLRPDEDKCCFSAIFEMDKTGKVHSRWFGRTIIRSDKRFAYEEVQQILDEGKGAFSEELNTLNQIAYKLRNNRLKEGSLNFDSQEVRFELDENGKPIGVTVRQRLDAHMLIEDFMLLTNRNVAQYVGQEINKSGKIPFVYRIHDSPDTEKLKDFSLFASHFGYKLNFDNPKKIASELNRLMLEAEDRPEEAVLQQLAIRCMAKAVYTTENIGHYGLGFEYYTHFTSPIRRYPDIMAHRLLQRILEKNKLPKKVELDIMANHCSERERAAMEAERESVRYKMIEYMEERIGEVFSAVISGIKSWGVYVDLPAYNTEGMIRLDSFSDDRYVVDEKNMMIRGIFTEKKYMVGDNIFVKLVQVDKHRKTIDFDLSSEKEFEKQLQGA